MRQLSPLNTRQGTISAMSMLDHRYVPNTQRLDLIREYISNKMLFSVFISCATLTLESVKVNEGGTHG